MNSRRLSLVIVAVNIGLLVTLAYVAYTTRFHPGVATAPERGRLLTNTVTQIAVRKVNATNLLEALAARPQDWHMLESSNYVEYIENLRKFGCPDETIRDIIITDVAKLYARRRAELRSTAPPQRFWQTLDVLGGASGAGAELQRQLRALDKEQRDLIRELLGVDLRAEMTKYWNEEDLQNFDDDYLPEGKRSEIRSVQEKYDDLEQAIYSRSRGLLLDEDKAELRKIQKLREADLAAVLTPEEFEEYQLRHSETANNMRSQLGGFSPTEEEFRKIFRLQKTFDDEFNTALGATDESGAEIKTRAQQEAQAALTEELKKTLGPERFAEYQRAQDSDYRTLLQISERFALAPEVANNVYNMKLAAERQKERIESDPNLTPQQQVQALAAVAAATERSVAGAMGDKVFKSYQKSGANWLTGLLALPADLADALTASPDSGPPLPPSPPGFPLRSILGFPPLPPPPGSGVPPNVVPSR